jgi:2-succinyl-5-enolpyruvyl-6-hydroxy-3-cyclohexene-1-carboxylate synthase
MVVVNNDGGGIFHFLPQVEHPEYFEELLVVPHGQNLAAIVEGFGAHHRRIGGSEELTDALAAPPKGVQVLEVVTDRGENEALHRRLLAAAAEAIVET